VTLVHLRGENGAELYFDRDALPEGVAKRIKRGDLTEIPAAALADDGPEDEADVPPPDAPPLPARSANRAIWTAFAISQGMDREEAAALTKTELISRLTGGQA
jgi:hypothetical protein